MDQLRAMRVFVEVVEQGSLSAAAESLGASLSSVVRTLYALETELGVRLINRTTRRTALTKEGERYVERCRDILAAVERADAEVRGTDEPSGTLRVAAPVLLGERALSPSVMAFMRRYPKIQCNLEFDDRLVDLIGDRFDLALRVGHLQDSTLIAQQVGVVRRVTVASPDYLARQGKPNSVEDLMRGNWIKHPGLNADRLQPLRDNGAPIALRGDLEFNHSTAALKACLSGAGYSRFAWPLVHEHVTGGRLEQVVEACDEQVPINVVYPHAQLPSRTRIFVDWLKEDLPARLNA